MKIFLTLFICPLFALDVLVTLPPFAHYVEAIGGNLVTVQSLMPSGASPHTYEPTPQQVRQAASAKIWFRIGEPVEERVIRALGNTRLVDLRKGIHLLTKDLHFWLSPVEAQIFSRTIAEALIEEMPAKKGQIENNLRRLLGKLRSMNEELKQKLAPCWGSAIFVSHPSFAYFCRAYGLREIPIEREGREPTPRELAKLLQTNARLVILQPQFNPKGGERVAQELDLPTCTINPLDPNPIATMKALGRCICRP